MKIFDRIKNVSNEAIALTVVLAVVFLILLSIFTVGLPITAGMIVIITVLVVVSIGLYAIGRAMYFAILGYLESWRR